MSDTYKSDFTELYQTLKITIHRSFCKLFFDMDWSKLHRRNLLKHRVHVNKEMQILWH